MTQTWNVNNNLDSFWELINDTPVMNSVEAYNLFMHGLNVYLNQLGGTLGPFWGQEQVIELVNKVTIYGEDKRGS